MSPAPRDQMHYMAKFSNTSQYSLTSSSSGTCVVVIVPQACFVSNPTSASPLQYYNFLTINNVNPTTPMINASLFAGPFASVSSQVGIMAPDVCNVRFINTMSALTSAGKVISSVYY